jgi:hypothetical protein
MEIELKTKTPVKIFSEVKEDELTEQEKFRLKQWRESEKIESNPHKEINKRTKEARNGNNNKM